MWCTVTWTISPILWPEQPVLPVLTTLHGRLDLPEHQPLSATSDDVPLVSISDSPRRSVPDRNWLATIYHGIELDEFTFNPLMGGYLAFLGRISRDKGLDTAIRAARRAGMPLRIAARMPLPDRQDPDVQADWSYWEDEIQPLLKGRQVELLGELADRDKDEFLRNAADYCFRSAGLSRLDWSWSKRSRAGRQYWH